LRLNRPGKYDPDPFFSVTQGDFLRKTTQGEILYRVIVGQRLFIKILDMPANSTAHENIHRKIGPGRGRGGFQP